MRFPVQAVAVAGHSMTPTLRPGDFLLVRRGAPVRPGDLVVVRRPDRPDVLIVKRAIRRAEAKRWWVEGDNPAHSDDSRLFGPAEVVARVLWRYWPPARIRS